MKVTGEDLAALLQHIHEHYPNKGGAIIYFEKDLLKIFDAIGLPKPIWGKSISVAKYKKKLLNKEQEVQASVASKDEQS